MVIFLRFYIRRKKKLLRSVTKSNDLVNSYLIESISNVDTVKGTHLEKRFIDTFLLKYKKLISNSYNYSVFIEYGELFKNIINDILLVLIYAYGSYLIIMQRISLGTLIVYQSFFMYCLNSFNGLIELSSDVVDFVVSLERIEDMFLIKEENFKNSFYFLPYKLNGDIEFINFSYKISSKYLFWNVNLLIKQGSKVLIYGKSGSGKSTLLKILMRYIDVPFGMVKINGIDINHYHLENIRRNICYVSSNEYLFTDSLKNNICLYKDVLEDDFNEINRICLVDEIIEEEELGYDKLVEENGFNFSSGEKQRIVLARSLLKNSDIYIFDEALGQIDTAQERIILSNIFTYLKDKTIIVISHRLNNASIFDKLIRIEDGCIYED